MDANAKLQMELLLDALQEARADLLDQAASLSDAQQETVFLGIWSIKELLAHLAGWDVTNLEAVKDILAGKVPVFYDHYDHDWQSYNATLVAAYGRATIQELLSRMQDSHNQLMEFLQGIPAEDFLKDYGLRTRGQKVTIQRLLEAELKDELIHFQQIIEFFKPPK
jgi:hypothetical protein